MRVRVPRFWSGYHLERGWRALALLLAVATLLELAACTGLAYVAGFDRVRQALGAFDWLWLLVLPVAWLVSLAGYYFAYRGIFAGKEPAPISQRHLIALVVAGFGGFLAYRGRSLELYALQAAGAEDADARARVTSFGALEQGVLGLGGCLVAVAVLCAGVRTPPLSITLAWAIVPVPAFILAFLVVGKCWRLASRESGWQPILRTFLASVIIVRDLFLHPRRGGPVIAGMALFWLADGAAAWAALACFGYAMKPAALFLGFASGMLFTRRTGPLAGAGILALLLPLMISYCGVPLAVAIAGVFVYRILSLWLLMPAWLLAIPTLRAMCLPSGAFAAVVAGSGN
jgi:hypothetical protein